jgi:hypothetical protein
MGKQQIVHDFLRELKKKTMMIISLSPGLDAFLSAFVITKMLVVLEDSASSESFTGYSGWRTGC